MIFEKGFEVTIDIDDPISACADKKTYIMNELSRIYVNKCFKGSYILNIKKINKISECRIVKQTTDAIGVCDVQFNANVCIISKWDIIVGVEIKTTNIMITGLCDEYGVATFVPSKGANSLTVGQKAIIKVEMAKHDNMHRVNIVGRFLECDKSNIVYLVNGALDNSAMADFALLVKNIKEELAERRKLDSSKLWFFEHLLYVYANDTSKLQTTDCGNGDIWNGPIGGNTNILEIANKVMNGETVNVSGYWSRPMNIYKSSPFAERVESTPEAYIESNPRMLFSIMLKNIYDNLNAIRRMVELYGDEEILNMHSNIWNHMRAAQLRV